MNYFHIYVYESEITGDIRVVYNIYDDIAYFEDMGTHNQVC